MKVYIDIGTNLMQGFRQISQIENINDDWKKVFIEPNPECWPDIENSIKYLKNSFFYKNAVSSENKVVTLITRSDNEKDMAATIMGESYLKDSLSRWSIYVDKFNRYEVETITMDDIFREINSDDYVILKIDAEGVEYEILEDILDKSFNIKKLYCEFHVHCVEDSIKKNELIDKISKKVQFIEWH
jgi:FkbM family methyltransferase